MSAELRHGSGQGKSKIPLKTTPRPHSLSLTTPPNQPSALPPDQSLPDDPFDWPALRQPLEDYINPHGEDNPHREALNAVQPPDDIVVCPVTGTPANDDVNSTDTHR